MNFDQQLQHLIEEALKEDVGNGDHSTLSCISATEQGTAVLKIKEPGILAGVDVAEKIFRLRDPSAVFKAFKFDGDAMDIGEKAFVCKVPIQKWPPGESPLCFRSNPLTPLLLKKSLTISCAWALL